MVIPLLPEIVVFSAENEELKKILVMQYELYSYIDKLFILAEASDDFDKEVLRGEIDFLKENLLWFESLIGDQDEIPAAEN